MRSRVTCRCIALVLVALACRAAPCGAGPGAEPRLRHQPDSSRPDARPAVDGAGAPAVGIPRLDTEIVIDGQLDESGWQQAARLAGFSQYRPVDSRPAEERTEVLVWYSPSALHIGVIAHDREPGSVRATVADRDNLARDDTVTIYLDTFLDRRRAFFFGVNPLGAQEDGVFSEGQFNAGTMMGGSTDRNPDYLFDSRGRLTADGYVVEIRIPFKSLRYPSGREQRWGFNVLRKVQRTGYEDTWTDVRRAASFLAQAGTLEGLHDLERGVVTEVQPFTTAIATGTRTARGFERAGIDPDIGVNARLGGTNLSIDATVNPDFSQVESDVGQVTLNERFALFYPEKRPFFLEGIELFATPNQLVYTRRIVEPVGGGKLTGKVGRFGIAYLSALDDTPGDHAWVNVARVRIDVGADSVAGVTFTDRALEGEGNRVVAADARYVFGKLYYVQGQVGGSWTANGTGTRAAPVWLAEFDRTGRSFGFNYKLTGFGEGFDARAGFVPRTNIVEGHAFNRFTWYGARGAAFENVTFFAGPTRIWEHDRFGRSAPIEGRDSVSSTVQMRGGWTVTGRVQREFFVLGREDYAGYTVEGATGSLVAYDAPGRLDGLWNWSSGLTTATWQGFDASVTVEGGATPIFDEGSKGRETRLSASAALRPTPSLRLAVSNVFAELTRERDGSEFARTLLPRVSFEYQPRRSLFFRVIGEYRAERVAALRDAATGALLFLGDVATAASASNTLRLDWLVSYEPSPGTVAYFGYGASMQAPHGSRWSDLQRTTDGFFLKLAYLLRR
jgi:hypothetical protein